MEDTSRGLYGLLFHPEVAHTDHGLELLRHFAFDVCGCTGDWTMASFIDEATSRIRSQVGDGRVICGLSGGRGLHRRGAADPPRHRRPPDLHLRGQRACCVLDEATQVQQRFRDKMQPAARIRGCLGDFPDAPGRRHRPRAEAEDHRADVHRGVRGEGRRSGALRFPRAGHAVSRRDRVGVGRRPVVGDQEPSQRRRAARAHAVQAGGASARAVQGRGPPARARPRARRGVRRSGSRSRARDWPSASLAR